MKNAENEAVIAKLIAHELAITTALVIAAGAHTKERARKLIEGYEERYSKQRVDGASPEFEKLVRSTVLEVLAAAKSELGL